MSVKAKANLYLVHQETSQRYPVKGEVIIGRTGGDIVFPEDAKLSPQHCRIFLSPDGLGVHDLKSGSGTFLDGAALDAKKVYALKVGNLLTAGNQTFQLQEASITRKPRKKVLRKKSSSFDLVTFGAGVLFIIALGLFVRIYLSTPQGKKTIQAAKMNTPLEMVEK
jgi:pSer/pThr/pTyr-binding forkhead associated (FHA) protein